MSERDDEKKNDAGHEGAANVSNEEGRLRVPSYGLCDTRPTRRRAVREERKFHLERRMKVDRSDEITSEEKMESRSARDIALRGLRRMQMKGDVGFRKRRPDRSRLREGGKNDERGR
jgi:hypothetical protein